MSTPYDAEIAATRPENTRYLLMAKREGYLARAAEPDPVKQALVEALRNLTDMVVEREQGNHDLDDELAAALAALALAEKEETEL